jgi:hypothetical protein
VLKVSCIATHRETSQEIRQPSLNHTAMHMDNQMVRIHELLDNDPNHRK